jgi:hypothetical protein
MIRGQLPAFLGSPTSYVDIVGIGPDPVLIRVGIHLLHAVANIGIRFAQGEGQVIVPPSRKPESVAMVVGLIHGTTTATTSL